LGSVPGVQFISLQKGAGEDEARHPPDGLALLHLGSQMEDFADAAAIVAQLDLVISVDTAIAHLAGALGKPCWLLLPDFMTDWRWQSERSDSPWYPGVMRLFRQPSRGDWAPVMAALEAALATWSAERKPTAGSLLGEH
jgi:ADP-heptose:LPS heptosyltransferase